MPHLDELLTEEHFRSLLMKFTELAHPYLMESVSYTRDVRRIPLKYDQPTDEKEQIHLQSSYDGLRLFVPVNIHAANISTIDGLMNVVHILQDLEGFDSHEHRRHGKYSLLHVDCKIYWQLLRMLYSFPGLVGMRHDLFLVFGFWHAYHYANIALWHEFRYTFLGPAYFTIFPDQKLLHRPKLTQSATFFMWLRLAYPHFKEQLQRSLATMKARVLSWALENARAIAHGERIETKDNPSLPPYIHLLNLHALFEFCIPCIQDYGCTLKGHDWSSFFTSFTRLLLFFISCANKGSAEYYRAMLFFHAILTKWFELGVPIADLLRVNHTVFSEESGEIALSVLAFSQPPNARPDLKVTRNYWHLTRERYCSLRSGDDLPRIKKHRVVGMYILSSLDCIDFDDCAVILSSLLSLFCALVDCFPSCRK